ncbi:class I SAM-dependent methyltransferase [Halalkalibacterium halodurans]|jgi:site-specific DNA-methyltransferase (adenine-specific)|uniref:BH3193 protein n=2 Tax=Halalkalibacterium halodurans TaxID=86665 RepID=Q9K814_HALH5|nr:class I SAM-dependent methyltransferase [Halalkalibacterium halodurans]MDY7223726.1 class I SAM-dependent methyltransferase [Halalkalibacterium halodurans]MDY7242947.1 class I SAM-dependent methyltransferase [Halalkalibacterium halodurans]MED3647206.1 class I SAM-dependent methyltransferase [Halalkalibacterium halodurans]MED4081131.1 class I SAM-dependent methyltransferase [Halalkalibacterium halodurans]MED4084374.1 class I SAM-dependent methyltransferase [Halalkalibacterium halodurans]
MEAQTVIEKLYTALDEGTTVLAKEQDVTYLEALAEMGNNIFYQEVRQEVSEVSLASLEKKVQEAATLELQAETVRKAFQLAVLKGMREATQPHHAMTPDAVCGFMSYLLNKVTASYPKGYTILDLAVGSGNLLTALLNQSMQPANGLGFEVDETLLKLAFVNANLQERQLELFHQDSLQVSKQGTVDIVATDLPVGYYPRDDVAERFSLKAADGHSYIHHLMIEHGIRQVREAGYLLFVVPNGLFNSPYAQDLHAFLKEETVILGLLQLPKSMFKAEQHEKSLLLLQKKGEGVRPPQQALLAELPSFTKREALADMVQQINKWFDEQLGL